MVMVCTLSLCAFNALTAAGQCLRLEAIQFADDGVAGNAFDQESIMRFSVLCRQWCRLPNRRYGIPVDDSGSVFYADTVGDFACGPCAAVFAVGFCCIF